MAPCCIAPPFYEFFIRHPKTPLRNITRTLEAAQKTAVQRHGRYNASCSCLCICSILRHDVSKCRCSISQPMNSKPRSTAATPVVPLPMYGSKIIAGFPACRMHHFIRAIGFCVGCSRDSPHSLCFATPFHMCRKTRTVPLQFDHAISASANVNPVSCRCLSHTSQRGDGGSLSA